MNDPVVCLPGKKENWNGYHLFQFEFSGRVCKVVVPSCPLPGKKWFWRAKFFNAFPNFDLAMVRSGFYLVHIDVTEEADPVCAIRKMEEFYELLTGQYGFDSRCFMEAYCTGAITALRWAEVHPATMAALYLDNPVFGERNWSLASAKVPPIPGTSAENGKEAAPFSMETLQVLVGAGIPVRMIYNRDDNTCRTGKNALLFRQEYQKLGGEILAVEQPGSSHGPHCLENPEPLVRFAAEALCANL